MDIPRDRQINRLTPPCKHNVNRQITPHGHTEMVRQIDKYLHGHVLQEIACLFSAMK